MYMFSKRRNEKTKNEFISILHIEAKSLNTTTFSKNRLKIEKYLFDRYNMYIKIKLFYKNNNGIDDLFLSLFTESNNSIQKIIDIPVNKNYIFEILDKEIHFFKTKRRK